MKTTNSKTITDYKFEDSKENLRKVFYGNLGVAVIMLIVFGDIYTLIFYPRFLICLFTFFLFFAAARLYDWRSTKFNFLFVLMYIGLLMLELFLAGLPNQFWYEDLGLINGGSKGIMFLMIVCGMPWMYLLTRIILVIPLIQVFIIPLNNRDKA